MHSHCAMQAMSDAVAAQKRLALWGESRLEVIAALLLLSIPQGVWFVVAPCTDLKFGTPNSQFYSFETPRERKSEVRRSTTSVMERFVVSR